MAWATYAHRYVEAELEAMDPVEVALAQYRVNGDLHDRVRAGRISQLLFPLGPPEYHDPRPTLSTPSPPRKRACIPASTNAILGLREVVSTSTMDGHCAICFKALAASQECHDKDATADDDDDLKALLALVADHQDAHEEEEGEDEDAKVTWLQPPRLRVMPCSHIFHQRCIFKWLSRNAACPLCHHRLPTVDDDEDEEEEDYEEPDDDDDDDHRTTIVASSC